MSGQLNSGNPPMDKGKIDHPIDLARQVIFRSQTVETCYLQRGLLRQRFAKHAPPESKVPTKGEDFVSGLKPPSGDFFQQHL